MSASRVAPKLWQGSKPPEGPGLAAQGFQLLVLCAMEHQPHAQAFPGLAVVHAPNDDADRPPSTAEWERAVRAALQVAEALQHDRRALVTCQQGRNRSGLVSALALRLATGRPMGECIALVQAHRRDALTNEHFVRALLSWRP